jgi:hypothetical protein
MSHTEPPKLDKSPAKRPPSAKQGNPTGENRSMKQTKEQLKITIAEAARDEWDALAASAIYNAAKCRSLANDANAPDVFRSIAEAELETAERNAEGNLQALRASITAINVLRGMSDEAAAADADQFARARTDIQNQEEAEAIGATK